MDRSPLHPLRLLPALLATADQGRRHFESEIEQWLVAQSEGGPQPVADGAEGLAMQAFNGTLAADHPATGTPSVPPAGETIPESGQ